MSLILDALRKMEQERRSKRGNTQDLRPEVLRYRLAAQPKERSRYPLVIAAGLALLCAGLGAGFMLKGRGGTQVADEAPAGLSAAQPAAAVQPPAVAVPVPAAPAAVAAPQPVPAPPAAAPAAYAQPVVGAATPVSPPEERSGKTPRAATTAAPEAAPPPRAPREEKATAAAGGQDIVISGIAYQDERRMRRAVLNGTLVGEGAEVAGARVVEIRETKVRLSRGGHVFEVPFSSGMQSR